MKILKGLCSVVLVAVLCLSLSVVCFAGEAVIAGDANGDKIVDVRDIVRMKRSLAYEGIDIDINAVDFDSNGKIDTYELVQVRNLLLEAVAPEVLVNVNSLESNW